MADVREQRIYCAEQIIVPNDLPAILKHYSKEVIRNKPENIIEFSAKYVLFSIIYDYHEKNKTKKKIIN